MLNIDKYSNEDNLQNLITWNQAMLLVEQPAAPAYSACTSFQP